MLPPGRQSELNWLIGYPACAPALADVWTTALPCSCWNWVQNSYSKSKSQRPFVEIILSIFLALCSNARHMIWGGYFYYRFTDNYFPTHSGLEVVSCVWFQVMCAGWRRSSETDRYSRGKQSRQNGSEQKTWNPDKKKQWKGVRAQSHLLSQQMG